MIFTGLKRKSNQIFFKKNLPSLLKNALKSPIDEVKKVIIFLDTNADRTSVLSSLMSILKISESDIKVVIFQQKLRNEQEANEVITPKDFGWYGKIESEKLKNILTNQYDLLINYSKGDNLYLNLLLLQCKASFKVGFAHLDKRLYDLMIQCESDERDLFNEELKKYLVILKIIR
ncbi:hypothetical protein [Lutibacter sp.]|uniref:DUF6913 domain-containing protein n=1 Tax=Lutibacter sp. TaxID=1925666 RepID=UPI003569C20F